MKMNQWTTATGSVMRKMGLVNDPAHVSSIKGRGVMAPEIPVPLPLPRADNGRRVALYKQQVYRLAVRGGCLHEGDADQKDDE